VIARKILAISIFATGLIGCSGQIDEPGTDDGCGVHGAVACRVSFRALASSPEAYSGRYIRMEGYLGVSGRLFVLSSSKELIDAGVVDEVSVRIRGPIEIQREIFEKHAYSWVSVTGNFSLKAKNGTTDDLLLGELSPPLEVRPLRFPIPVQKQQFGELAIDLEDLK
jgi:hypothetical protein